MRFSRFELLPAAALRYADCMAGPAELSGLRVLVVDDDEDTLDLSRHLLEAAGAEVTTADSAPAALAAISESSFHVVVSDVGLPEQDGLALMREIRARGHGADQLPAIALTGYASLTDERLTNDAGFQAHLAKPVDALALLSAIARLASPVAPL